MEKPHTPSVPEVIKGRMKKFLIILSLAVFLGGWLYFYKIHRTPSAIEYTDITSTQLKTMLQKKDFYFINVHTPYEGEIEKTDAFIPYDRIDENLNKFPKDLTIITATKDRHQLVRGRPFTPRVFR